MITSIVWRSALSMKKLPRVLRSFAGAPDGGDEDEEDEDENTR